MVQVECVQPRYGFNTLVVGGVYWLNEKSVCDIQMGNKAEYASIYLDKEQKTWVGFLRTSHFKELVA